MLTKLMNLELGYWKWCMDFYVKHPMVMHVSNVIMIIGVIVWTIWAIQCFIEWRKFNKEMDEQEHDEI